MAEEINEILVALRSASGGTDRKRMNRLIRLAAENHIEIDTIASTARQPLWKVRKVIQEGK